MLTAAITLASTLAIFVGIWLLSTRLTDAGIVDLYWGPGFAVVALLTVLIEGLDGFAPFLLLVMVLIWAARLGFHMAARHARAEREDPRYARMREERGEAFARWSLANVFLLQAAILWVVASPIHAAFLPGANAPDGAVWSFLLMAGAMLFAAGLVIEWLADSQLAAFRNDPDNRGRLLTTGLFGVVRHPNYLGEIMLWWGLGLVALALSGRWWALVGPAVLTAILLKISGPPMLATVLEGREGYREWVARTPALWPFRRRDQRI
jgi:steroid 5-alpha reductase family enzyme